jgi:murein DD-endopeptidase MepM/ murein hydrolase activator NlpD
MSKRLLWIVLALCVLIGAQYVFLALQAAIHGIRLFPAINAFEPASDGLSLVNFDLFRHGGAGWSYITQGYGRTPYSYLYPDGWHDGIDIGAAYGAPIYAPVAGTVIATGNQDNFCYHKGFGEYVAMNDAAHGRILWFAHLGDIRISPGERVSSGTIIGSVGATGLEFGTHLHFSVFIANGFTMAPRNGCGPEPTGRDVDPVPYLQALNK